MRRLNDVKRVADFICSNFKSDEFKIKDCESSWDIIVPYFPASIVSLVSSDIRIGVFPYDDKHVHVNIYKL